LNRFKKNNINIQIKEITDKQIIIINNNKKHINEKNELISYEHSDYYILTNNINLTNEKLKEIYKKRWSSYAFTDRSLQQKVFC